MSTSFFRVIFLFLLLLYKYHYDTMRKIKHGGVVMKKDLILEQLSNPSQDVPCQYSTD